MQLLSKFWTCYELNYEHLFSDQDNSVVLLLSEL